MKKFTLFLISGLIALSGFAQNRSNNNGAEISKIKEVTMAKTAYLKSVLDLTQKEADLFWPVYSKYLETRELYTAKRRSCITGFNNYMDGRNKTMNERGVKTLLDLFSFYDEAIVKLDKSFYLEIQKILPIKKQVAFYKAEEDFRVKLLQQLKNSKP